MSLKVQFFADPGGSYAYSLERDSDSYVYDQSTGQFSAAPATPLAALVEGSGNNAGRYEATIASTPKATFVNGGHTVVVHDAARANRSVVGIPFNFYEGDTSAPSASGSILDDPIVRARLVGDVAPVGPDRAFVYLDPDGVTPRLRFDPNGGGRLVTLNPTPDPPATP